MFIVLVYFGGVSGRVAGGRELEMELGGSECLEMAGARSGSLRVVVFAGRCDRLDGQMWYLLGSEQCCDCPRHNMAAL